jgi:hypothetical protein
VTDSGVSKCGGEPFFFRRAPNDRAVVIPQN